MARLKMKIVLITQLLPWIERFLMKDSYLDEKTCRRYRHSILVFTTYLEKSSKNKKSFALKIKQKVITGWLKEITAHHTLTSALGRVGTVARFLSFLKENGVLQKNPLGTLQERYPREGLKGIVLALIGPSPRKSLQALKASPRFASPLGPYMKKFISLHRSQGEIYQRGEYMLSRFDRFLRSYSDPPKRLSDTIVRQWLSLFSKNGSITRYKSFLIVRNFCLYLRRFDPTAYVPDISLTSTPSSSFFPHIYSRAEVVAILKETRKLKPSTWTPLRPQTFYLLILLLYTTGIRLGEALRLRLNGIDWKEEALYIRETKFFKSRLVPLSHSMMKQLKNYVQLRQRVGLPTNSQSLLFQNPHKQGPYANSSIRETFQSLLEHLDLKSAEHGGPRIHDLRHTFACHRLEEWYRKGENVQSKLGFLSTYLGHVNLDSTQRYLTMTTELLQQASKRFNQYFTQTQKGELK